MPKRIVQGEMDGSAARNLRREGMCFSQRAREYMFFMFVIYTFRNEFFMNRVIFLWNELPQKVRESVTLNSFKAGLGKMKLFLT